MPGVAGSAHNGVSGIGGVFGVGGFREFAPSSRSMRPGEAVCAGVCVRERGEGRGIFKRFRGKVVPSKRGVGARGGSRLE